MVDAKYFLIIDDDADDREFFREAVSQVFPGVQCQEAIDGVEALKKLRIESEQLPDYIFLDLNMPRMDGKSVLVELKKDCQLKHIPVGIFTTSSAPEDKEESLILGAASFITKPYEFEKLCDSIQSVVELSCLRQD